MESLLGNGNRGRGDIPQLGHGHLIQVIQETERFLIPWKRESFHLGSPADRIPATFMANGEGRLGRSLVRLFDQEGPWRVFGDFPGSGILLDMKFRGHVDAVGNEPHHGVEASQGKIPMHRKVPARVARTDINKHGILRELIRFLIQPTADLVGQFADVVVGDRNATQ